MTVLLIASLVLREIVSMLALFTAIVILVLSVNPKASHGTVMKVPTMLAQKPVSYTRGGC